MTYPGIVYNFLIASPGDVNDERHIVRDVIHEWNINHSQNTGKVLMPFGWDTHSWPAFGDGPQEVINEQVVQFADLAVVVFGNKLGTPTNKYASGTVEEIEGLLAKGKSVMVYWLPKQVGPGDEERNVYDGLCEYINALRQKGLVFQVASLDQLKTRFASDLQRLMNSGPFPGWDVNAALAGSLVIDNSLSADAIELLEAAQNGKRGEILCDQRFDRVQTYSKILCQKDSREFARWKQAISDLHDQDYIDLLSDRMYTLTHKGYQANIDELLSLNR